MGSQIFSRNKTISVGSIQLSSDLWGYVESM
jgi:hypothetical protein